MRTWIAVLLAVTLAFILSPTAPAGATPINVGPIQFEVSFAKTPGAQLTSPQGQFFQLGLTAENISSQPAQLDLSSQFLRDDSGRTYAVDLGATSLFDPTGSSRFTPVPLINPGNTWRGFLFFDVESGTAPSDYQLVLQSPGGASATVQLVSCGTESDPCGRVMQ
jgi:hypothetical protein